MIDVSDFAGEVKRLKETLPKCYACDMKLDQPGRGDVPLCLRCRAGDGERTPEVEATFLDLMEKHATFRTEARCGKSVTAESSLGLNKALDEHSKACVACCAATSQANGNAEMKAAFPWPPDPLEASELALLKKLLRPEDCLDTLISDALSYTRSRLSRDDRDELGDGSEDEEC